MTADDREAALRRAPELSRGTFTASAPIDETLREERFTQVSMPFSSRFKALFRTHESPCTLCGLDPLFPDLMQH